MTSFSFFILFLFMLSLCAVIILIVELNGKDSKIKRFKEEIIDIRVSKNFWYNKAQQYRDLYFTEKKKTSSNVTWRTIMGFSKEEKITKEKLDRRYKALARAYHPDLESGSNYAMKLLNLAKEKANKNV